MGTRRSGRQGRRLKKLEEISLSAKDGYFDVKRSGKLTQSYDGDTEESAYEKVE